MRVPLAPSNLRALLAVRSRRVSLTAPFFLGGHRREGRGAPGATSYAGRWPRMMHATSRVQEAPARAFCPPGCSVPLPMLISCCLVGCPDDPLPSTCVCRLVCYVGDFPGLCVAGEFIQEVCLCVVLFDGCVSVCCVRQITCYYPCPTACPLNTYEARAPRHPPRQMGTPSAGKINCSTIRAGHPTRSPAYEKWSAATTASQHQKPDTKERTPEDPVVPGKKEKKR